MTSRRAFLQAVLRGQQLHPGGRITELYVFLMPDGRGSEVIVSPNFVPMITMNPKTAAGEYARTAQAYATKHQTVIEAVQFSQRRSVQTFRP